MPASPPLSISVADIEAEHIDQLLAVNVRGVILATKHVAPVMPARAPAASSISPASPPIAAASPAISIRRLKGAVTAFTRSARPNSAKKASESTASRRARSSPAFSASSRASKLPRPTGSRIWSTDLCGVPADPAGRPTGRYRAGRGLSGERRIGFVNGQDLVVDGGQTSVTRGWSTTVSGRAEMGRRIKAAAAAL